ncbi:MAG: uracil-DNA glycosylase [Treponema sp.]|jgi:DNA polymerase|nr:uracil-DNA glycosylase [Treponema sp.]
MTSAEKQKIACFLDIAGDYLGSGYKSACNEYQFDDDTENSPQITQSNADSIEIIAQEIKACGNCSLCQTRINAVPGEGVMQPVVMVIGEGPGEDEDKQGRPFVGKAGQLLDKMLSAIGLSRSENAFIANVVKCRPPKNRDPYPEETAACSQFLKRQISILKPQFILAAGRVSAQTLLKTTEPIGRLRGRFTELIVEDNIYPLLATYHPAALLRSEEYKRPAWEDLKLLRSKIGI